MSTCNLQRFHKAQENTYQDARREIKKASNWMWLIFPQLVGLGHSETAEFYAICNLNKRIVSTG